MCSIWKSHSSRLLKLKRCFVSSQKKWESLFNFFYCKKYMVKPGRKIWMYDSLAWLFSILFQVFKFVHYQKLSKTSYQPYVSAAEFLNNKRLHALFQTSFFLRAYQNLYVNPQPNNEKFMKWGRQQQLLTCITPSCKGYSWCFITFCINQKETVKTLKKQRTFFGLTFTLLISSLKYKIFTKSITMYINHGKLFVPR